MSAVVDRADNQLLGSPRQRRTGAGWVRGLCVLAATVLAAAPVTLAVRAGLTPAHSARALGVVVLTQLLPGVVAWRVLRPRDGWWLEDAGLGAALGIALAVAGQVVAGALGQRWLSAAVGPVCALVLLALPVTRRRAARARSAPLPAAWLPVTMGSVVLALTPLVAFLHQTPLHWSTGFRRLYPDVPYHLALAGQLAHRGPGAMPYAADEPLAYHWFSHAWVAQVAQASGVPIDEALLRVLPVLVVLLSALCVAAATLRLGGRPWTACLAAWLLLGTGDLLFFLDPRLPGTLSLLSPSLGLGHLVLPGLVVVLALHWRGQLPHATALPLLAVLGVTAAGIKGSTLPLPVAGTALALGVAVVTRRLALARRLAVDLAVLVAGLLAAAVFVLHGTSAGLRFDPASAVGATFLAKVVAPPDGNLGWGATAVVAACVVAVLLARGAGAVALVVSREARTDPVTWLLLGGALAGAVAVVTFDQVGSGQVYFVRSAAPLIAIAGALGIGRIWDWLSPRASWPLALGVLAVGVLAGIALADLPRRVLGPLAVGTAEQGRALAFLAAAVLILGLTAFAGALVSPAGRRAAAAAAAAVATVTASGTLVVVGSIEARLPPYATRVAPRAAFAVSADQIEAARWLRDHSGRNDLVATNRHCSTPAPPPGRCDARRFTLSAYTERRVLVEGWDYTDRANRLGQGLRGPYLVAYWRPDRLAAEDSFIAGPTAAGARRLADLGVRWVFVDRTARHADTLEPYAQRRFATEWATVYEIRGR